MGFKCGIVGLPNVGKSTIFNALTAAGAAAENYPFCTIDPNVGRVEVPDPRLQEITDIVKTQKVVPAAIEFVDIAGLVRGASRGEGLGNQFLSHIRETNAIAHVVRCFTSGDVTHVEGRVDPLEDISIIEAELILADNDTVEKALTRYRKLVKTGRKDIQVILGMLEACYEHLQNLKPARLFDYAHYCGEEVEAQNAWRDLHLITAKKVLYVCNVEEEMARGQTDNEMTKAVRGHAEAEGAGVVLISAQLEAELGGISDPAERQEMLSEFGMTEPGLGRLIRAGYDLLGLQTYFTAGEKEVRAWTIRAGSSAPQAAGVIHSDFEKGFICAEVLTLEDLCKEGSRVAVKNAGKLHLEGRDYIVQDGDIIEFRFNVDSGAKNR